MIWVTADLSLEMMEAKKGTTFLKCWKNEPKFIVNEPKFIEPKFNVNQSYTSRKKYSLRTKMKSIFSNETKFRESVTSRSSLKEWLK